MRPYVPVHSTIERVVKENVAAMDEAIAHLRKHGMVETADKLGGIRDYLARSESYYRRIEGNFRQEFDRKAKAERIWLDVTGRKGK